MKYHMTKEAAGKAASVIYNENPDRIAAYGIQFEPNRGYLVVLYPRPMDLSDLYDEAEVWYLHKKISPPSRLPRTFAPRPMTDKPLRQLSPRPAAASPPAPADLLSFKPWEM